MLFQSLFLCVGTALALDTFNYGAFTQTATYSIANQLGFFTAYNLNVTYLQVPNSTAAYASLLSGQYDLLTGTIDNAVNLKFNSGKNITVVGQLDQGPDLVLASIPGITQISQLKGKPLIVDSPVSGYAYLLRKVLSANGLYLENGDYYFQTVGGTSLRYADLINGVLPNGTAVYATILTYPFTAQGQTLTAGNPNILARISDYEAPISSSAFTVAQSSINDSDKSDLITRFLSAMYIANLYLNIRPLTKACAISAIKAQLGVTSATAALEYSAATNPVSGEISPGKFQISDFTVNTKGLKNVIAVRQEFGGFTTTANYNAANGQATVPGPGQMIDYSLRDDALAALKPWLLLNGC